MKIGQMLGLEIVGREALRSDEDDNGQDAWESVQSPKDVRQLTIGELTLALKVAIEAGAMGSMRPTCTNQMAQHNHTFLHRWQ
eukprot:scaffold241120_cov33-Tisochrysis_lutea.AAC.4